MGYYLVVFKNRFPKIGQIPPDIVGIIVLGTGFDLTVSAETNSPSYLPSIGVPWLLLNWLENIRHCDWFLQAEADIKI